MRRFATVVLTAGLMFATAPAALAGTVSKSGGVITYTAASGEANDLVVEVIGADYRFRERGAVPVTAGTLCAGGGATATCPTAGSTEIDILLGDGNDNANVDSAVTIPNVIQGAAGIDDLSGGAGPDAIDGGPGTDQLDGNAGNDTVHGGDGLDVLIGGTGANNLFGDGGDDISAAGSAGDVLSGGDGFDTLVVVAAGPGTFDASLDDQPNDGLAPNLMNVRADVESVDGESIAGFATAAMHVVGSDGPNLLRGGIGNDDIDGAGGTDTLSGGDGDDIIRARDGQPDQVYCGAGSDTAVIDAADSASECETVDRAAAPLPPAPPTAPAAPADLAPAVALSGLPSKVKYRDFVRKGIRFTATPNESSSLAASLLGATRVGQPARALPFNLVLATRSFAASADARRVTLKPTRRLLGRARKFTVRVSVVATDATGHATTVTKDVKVAPK
jgi:hypothetical protein